MLLIMMMIARRPVQLAAPRMRDADMRLVAGRRYDFIDMRAADHQVAGLGQAQRQLIAAHLYLYGIAHRGSLLYHDLGMRRQPHIQQMMTQRAAPFDCLDKSTLTGFQFVKSHALFSS